MAASSSQNQELLFDFLDDEIAENERENLYGALREEPALRGMAVEYALLDSQLDELVGTLPPMPTPQQLIQRAKRRVNIISAAGVDPEILEQGQAPSGSPAHPSPTAPEPASAPNEQNLNGTARNQRRRTPGKARGVRVYGTASRANINQQNWMPTLMAFAALVVLAVTAYFVFNRGKPAGPEVVEEKKKIEGPSKKNEVPDPTAPKAPEVKGPILALKGVGAQREGNLVWTDHRSTVEAALADGSTVEMQPNTKIDFGEPTEKVRQDLKFIKGKAVFNVSKEDRAFVVKIGASTLSVLGTKFSFVVPSPDERAEGSPAPAHIEVMEGRVKLNNPRGDLVLEREGGGLLCDAFAPLKIEPARGHSYLGFSGKIRGWVLARDRSRLLVRVQEAMPDGENRLEGARHMTGKALWLHLPSEREEEMHERAMHALNGAQIMQSLLVSSWTNDHRLIFGIPKPKEVRDGKEDAREERPDRERKEMRKDREGGERREKERGERERDEHRDKERNPERKAGNGREEGKVREGGDRREEGRNRKEGDRRKEGDGREVRKDRE